MRSFGIALAFLTRLPTWDPGVLPPEALGPPTRWYPVVGALVGAIAAVVYAAAHLVLPASLAALLAVAAGAAVTGALHEDGLADLADAAGVRGDAEARRTAMKDARLGTFGVLALILSVTLRAGALATLTPALAVGWLVLAHSVSRGALVLPLRLSAGQGGGLQAAVAESVSPIDVALALAVPTALTVAWLGLLTPGVLGLAAVGFAAPALWAHRRLGAVTGDVLGAGQQLTELALLLLAAALVTTGSHPEVPIWR